MVRPAHTLVEFSGVFGTLAQPIEQWSYGLRCAGHVAAADLDTVAVAATTAWIQEMQGITPASCRLTRTRVANIKGQDADDVAGRVAVNADGSYQLHDNPSEVIGTGEASTLPPQVAIVASLTTARQGPTGMGRIFLPSLSASSYEAGGRLNDGATTAIANNVRDLVSTLNAIGILGPVSVVSSRGYSSPVTGVRVGDVADTQRSRRNRMVETYTTASF